MYHGRRCFLHKQIFSERKRGVRVVNLSSDKNRGGGDDVEDQLEELFRVNKGTRRCAAEIASGRVTFCEIPLFPPIFIRSSDFVTSTSRDAHPDESAHAVYSRCRVYGDQMKQESQISPESYNSPCTYARGLSIQTRVCTHLRKLI